MEEKNSQKAYERVFDYFTAEITSGNLRLNDKIPTERALSEKLGVSRNSAREALHVLEMMGLIECIQGSGNYIRCNTKEYMTRLMSLTMVLQHIDRTEVFEMRCGFEQTALAAAMEDAKPEELERMHEVLEKMDQPMSAQDSAALDIQFHKILMEMSHNELMIFYVDQMENLLKLFVKDLRTSILSDRRRAAVLRKAHWDIYEALTVRDEAAGAKALKKHFSVVRKHLEKLI
ncbi:FadR family transcriptional regulator [Clostridium sp. OM02-18AC]|uniref:FadR/GntR family transcriptional regulator n=1 Tax=Clostridium sp. OM02-18AC TaxID=2292311 RepID=UPI000E52AF3B|nr:FCD domain-containing protein [Clostridium sp. OM02-18AC]RHV68397.1 FadR family transcriptional regulator [Clostridium sp. OM02-18AC]